MNDLLSGEYGPRFVGYGKEPTLWERWHLSLALGLGSGALALVIMWIEGSL